ncbi:ACP S-malonyltransferase [Leptospirillum ferriphilum]|jgi:[acyl-carrier-protein] S-malonyltransferase|uniref:Malonyl CoA-acyl carrier protein transacylase n=1 Tax=Leptospirillum ferriphilum TaxID=178606 RepID=A0A1V3SWW5_9BACT|nr:ACP S-malonyltransferase [Leptospirillum ferriphilum]OOH73925.1 [acyl-carrier-protein] S-malonyltransferase [Leptospirillum ferriphilum]OOH77268.1 [acyl-carrier-protein] S-malonyltransferase [Leptospirillum ferriphilum]
MTEKTDGKRSAWIFPGQGSQYRGMLRLVDGPREQVRLDEASEILGYPVRKLLGEDPDSVLDKTEWTQPALLLVSVLIAERKIREGIPLPDLYLGHSLGEYSALVMAGCLSFGEALHAVHLRGKAMQGAVPEGAGMMAAVLGFDRNELMAVLEKMPPPPPGEYAGMANVNSPGQIVIAGSRDRMLSAIDAIKSAGARKVIPLAVSVPSHTPLMEPAAREMRKVLENMMWKNPVSPVVSNATASASSDSSELRERLLRQITSPVLWEDSIREALRLGVEKFVEMGPGSVLTGIGKRISDSVIWESTDSTGKAGGKG